MIKYILPLLFVSSIVIAQQFPLPDDKYVPDTWWNAPTVRACCSQADAVWADEWHINPDGSVTARVTGGGPRNHDWAPIGRVYEVPADKILVEPEVTRGRPYRPMLFIAPRSLTLYCFAMGPTT